MRQLFWNLWVFLGEHLPIAVLLIFIKVWQAGGSLATIPALALCSTGLFLTPVFIPGMLLLAPARPCALTILQPLSRFSVMMICIPLYGRMASPLATGDGAERSLAVEELPQH